MRRTGEGCWEERARADRRQRGWWWRWQGGSVVRRVNCGSWEKAPRLLRETGGHETPARSLTFRLTAGLTAGSDAPEQSLPPPVRATPPARERASRPHFALHPSATCRTAGSHPPFPAFPASFVAYLLPSLPGANLPIATSDPLDATPRLVDVHPPLYALVTLQFFATRKR